VVGYGIIRKSVPIGPL